MVKPPLPAFPLTLLFSDRAIGAASGGTVWEHLRIIREGGACWWGWWRAETPGDLKEDHSGDFQNLVADGPAEVALYNKRAGRVYIATIDQVATRGGAPLNSPVPAMTPEYYRADLWPAWFRMTSIRRIDGAPITEFTELDPEDTTSQVDRLVERFRDIGATASTAIWLDDEVVRPTMASVKGSSILHLSDLHFGQSHEWSSSLAARGGRTQLDAIKQTLKSHNVGPESVGIIVISGDIADHGPDGARYEVAEKFVRDLWRFTETGPENLVIVPGNHDVIRHERDLGGEPELDFSQEEIHSERQKEGEKEYQQFCERLFGEVSAITRLRQFITPSNAINILQLNSTLPRDNFTKEYGFFGLEPLQFLEDMDERKTSADAAAKQGEPELINMAVAHHHPISTVKEEYVPDPDPGRPSLNDPVSTMVDQSNILDWCTQYRIRFLLHGHQHKTKFRFVSDRFSNRDQRNPFFTEILSAGTAGAKVRPDNEPMAFNVYDLLGDKMRVRAFGMDRQLAKRAPLYDFITPVKGEWR